MFSHNPKWFSDKMRETSELPHIKVTKAEFIKLFVKNGGKKKDAIFQANICEGLGSSVQIGKQMVSIKGD